MTAPQPSNDWVSSPRAPLEDVTTRVNNAQLQPLPSKCRRRSYLALEQAEHQPRAQHAIQKRESTRTADYLSHGFEIQRESSTRLKDGDTAEESLPSSPVPDYGEDVFNSRIHDNNRHYIGPWRLHEKLGQGAAGIVRRCEHRFTGQVAAVKILSKRSTQLVQAGSLNDLDQWDRAFPERVNGEMRVPIAIEREVAILKLIQHPNIVKLYDIWENKQEIYLFLEYVDGGDMFGHITRHGRLSEEGAITYFRQMMGAISYCHSFNICHRDLKPENILVTTGGAIKIADFSMAALHQTDAHKLATACGSPHYAAPELLSHKTYKGDKADIWSLGCILFAMLAGSLPFDHPDQNAMLDLVRSGEYLMPEFLSLEAKDLIRRLLQVKPARRITIKEMWRHPLILKYSYMDDYEDSQGRPSYIRNIFGYEALSPAQLDPQLLRQMQSLWHTFSEEELVDMLTSPERNDHKIFYWLLTKYREEQLENFSPDVVHSPSDYHHMKPSLWQKNKTTCDFAQEEAGIGHSGEASQFTVISRVPSTSDAETVESYDPFNSDRMPLPPRESDISRAMVTIHRSGSKKSSKSRGNSNYVSQVARLRQGSAMSGSSEAGGRYSVRHAGIVRVHTPVSSKSSIRSGRTSKSSKSGRYTRAVSGHQKRGVDFSRVRDRSGDRRGTSHGKEKQSVAATKTLANSICEGTPRQDSGILPLPRLRKHHEGVPITPEELSHFKSSLVEDIDKAFGQSLITENSVCGSMDEDRARRRDSSPLTLSFGPNSLFASTPAPDYQNWLDRPLPPLPSPKSTDTPSPSTTGVSNRVTRDSTGDNLHRARKIVNHVNNRLSLPLLSGLFHDRRIVSAPEDEVAPLTPESPTTNNQQEAQIKGKGKTGANTGGGRFSSAPQPELTHGRRMDQKDLEYLSRAEKTIRLVENSVMRPTGSNPFNHRRHVYPGPSQQLSGHQPVQVVENKAGPSGEDNTVTTRGGQRVHKKKPFWLKRQSYEPDTSIFSNCTTPAGSRIGRINSLGDVLPGSHPHAVHFASQTLVPTHRQVHAPVKKKRNFSLSFWKSGKKGTGNTRMAITHQEHDETPSPGMVAGHTTVAPNTEARTISVHRNWFAKLFDIQPARDYLCFSLLGKKVRVEIVNTLRDWRKYGIENIHIERERNTVFGQVGPNNYLGMKPVAFAAEIMTVLENGRRNPPLSIVRFTQERGAASSFHRVVDTMKEVFHNRNILVTDKTKAHRMVETAKVELELRMKAAEEVDTDQKKASTRRTWFPHFRK